MFNTKKHINEHKQKDSSENLLPCIYKIFKKQSKCMSVVDNVNPRYRATKPQLTIHFLGMTQSCDFEWDQCIHFIFIFIIIVI